MRVAVIGAGFSGIATARTLRAFGLDVAVYEAAPDVGGVWSATRSYPGISTQNDKGTYAFSDHPMPDSFPENPSGDQVRAYLEEYVALHGLGPALRLGTKVLRAEQVSDAGRRRWRLTLANETDPPEPFDALVMATGLFSAPHIPQWPGRDLFEQAGGTVTTPSDVHTAESASGRSVTVVGWGKSACDVAVAVADSARATTVVARSMRWKVPRRLGRISLYRRLLLSRAGQYLLWHPTRTRFGRATYRLQRIPRSAVLLVLERLIAHDQGLEPLGLLPDGHLPNTISQPTSGLHERVADGRIRVRRGAVIRGFTITDGGEPAVLLDDGSVLRTDLIVAATGYEQDLSVLAPEALQALRDDDGVMRLHRGIAAIRVPGLYFAGFAASMFSPLSAEISALWIAAALTGRLRRPEPRLEHGTPFYLSHARAERVGATQVPGQSISDLDVLLRDVGYRLPWTVRVSQWWRILAPGDYRGALQRLVEEAAAGTPIGSSAES